MWAYGSYVGGRLLILLSTAILARLLSPHEFGLVALAVVFTGLLETVRDFGVTYALIVVADDDLEERANTAWWISLGIGVVLAGITALVAPLAAGLFDQPGLAPLLTVLGLNFPLRALGLTHYVLAQRRIDFRVRTMAETADVLVRGTACVVLALAGFGAWSLIIGYLVGTVSLVITLWTLIPWRPGRPSLAHWRELLDFGGKLTVIGVFHTAAASLDDLWVGKVLGSVQLGFYSIAYRLPMLVIENLSNVASEVLFPAMAAVERSALREAYGTALRYVLAVALPSAAFLAVMAEPLILLTFGDQWRPSIAPMQVLVAYFAVATVGVPAGVIFKATKRPEILIWLAIPNLGLLIVGLVLFADRGLVAVALAQLVSTGVAAACNMWLATRHVGARPADFARAAWAPLLSAAAMAGVLLATRRVIDPMLLELAVGGLAGGAAYVVAVRLLVPDLVADARAKLRAGA